MFSSELLIQMCTKSLPAGSVCVFVWAEEAEGVICEELRDMKHEPCIHQKLRKDFLFCRDKEASF